MGTTTIPSPLTILQKYYVTNCSTTPVCGSVSSTFQVAATPGGPAITRITFPGTCGLTGVIIAEPLQVTVGSSTITSPDSISAWTTGTPIAFASAGLQAFGSLSPPLALNTVYYITAVAARTFSVSLTQGGPPITITGNGSGPLQAANPNVPGYWAFRGLEMTEVPGRLIYGFLVLGTGSETSTLGMVSNMEVDRCYLHEQPGDATPPVRGIAENGINASIHDSYIAGMSTGESQAIAGWGSPGSTAITNNFLEASGENVMYGGNYNSSGTPNANKIFSGNYFYKPPSWKVTVSTGAASGPCFTIRPTPTIAVVNGIRIPRAHSGINAARTALGPRRIQHPLRVQAVYLRTFPNIRTPNFSRTPAICSTIAGVVRNKCDRRYAASFSK